MKHLKLAAFAMIGALIAIGGQGAAFASSENASINIRGTVRTVCRVQFNQPTVANGAVIQLGQMQQLCNNIDGYRVVMQHPAGLNGATVSVDGVETPLSSGNETILVDSNRPDFRTSEVSLNFGDMAGPGALSFRIEPKGTLY
ncbi:MAG: hypothetical protein KF780_08955 [Sphingomonas sp.]|nr:hypothetical protein [Sphingomonas sp.]